MKNKILLLLLIIPFAIVFVAFLSADVIIDKIKTEMSDIHMEHEQNEGLLIDEEMELIAEPIVPPGYVLSDEDKIVWESSDENVVVIIERNGHYYAKAVGIGEATITCKATKGNIFKSFTMLVVDKPTLSINSKNPESASSFTRKNYFGQYDYDDNFNKIPAKTGLNIKVIGDDSITNFEISPLTEEDATKVKISDNNEISFTGYGEISVLIESPGVNEAAYTFNVVEDGVNIYDFEDLMHATNLNKNGGDVVVLRNNFGTEEDAKKYDNYEIFGDINKKIPNGERDSNVLRYDFSDYLYSIETTFNREFIDIYNEEFVKNNEFEDPLPSKVFVGVRIQKDFYGNGYIVDASNLCFPSGTPVMTEGGAYIYPTTDNDYFKGPLIYYQISDAVRIFGQDNIGFYVDGDNITLQDVNFSNGGNRQIDALINYNNLGTVLEINGSNINILNSRFSKGRNIIRDFSTYDKETKKSTNENILIKNCLLEKSREFLLKVGSNSYERASTGRINAKYGGGIYGNGSNADNSKFAREFTKIFSEYANNVSESKANELLEQFKKLQDMINLDNELIKDEKGEIIYAGNTTVEDCYFTEAGLFSISMDSMFQGPVLYGEYPIKLMNEVVNGMNNNIEYEIAGLSYPSILNLKGDTRFYDWKNIEKVDAGSLIGGNGYDNINAKDFLPLQKIINSYIDVQSDLAHVHDGVRYVNGAIAYYGGGTNLSKINFDELDNKELFVKKGYDEFNDESINLDVNLFTYFANNNEPNAFQNKIQKCIPFAAGSNSFIFNTYRNSSETGSNIDDLFDPNNKSNPGNKAYNLNDFILRASEQ